MYYVDKPLPFLCHLRLRDFEGCQRVQRALPLSTTANTVTTATQPHLELQENHPKFLWARQRPLSPSKLVRSLFFFRPLAGPPPLQPLVRDPRSATPLQLTRNPYSHIFLCPGKIHANSVLKATCLTIYRNYLNFVPS